MTTTTTSQTAAPAWDTYLYSLCALEAAEASYSYYWHLGQQIPDGADRATVRRSGQMLTYTHNAVTNTRRAVIEARRAYTLALELEGE